MREARGVYYTPEPVVSYIVRSVDAILKKDFKLSAGLADASKIKLTRPKLRGKGTETIETHKVQILDPATGTGTFLYSVIGQIYQTFAGNKGMWPGYVQENLLPRVYGFELLMAPYAVAHMKLGLLLRETGYDFSSDERLRVFLTNTLEEAHEMTGLPLFTQWLADEATSANLVKKETPVMVVLGNPPYSGHSANTGEWIAGLLRGIDSTTGQKTGNYFEVDGAPLGERNPKWLNDDYVKFIRFAQWRIEQTGYGVLAFVTNHGYLDNPTFRGMRQSLMQSFDDIYLLDLHGNSKKKEKAPDGGKDENVFDIQQGVAIGIFVKRTPSPQPLSRQGRGADELPSPLAGEGPGERGKFATVYRADLYGTRESKYATLAERDITTTLWQTLQPQSPAYLFAQQNSEMLSEYENFHLVTDIFLTYASTVTTARNDFSMSYQPGELVSRIEDLRNKENSDDLIREKYLLKDVSYWKLSDARKELGAISQNEVPTFVKNYCYRPFDFRYVYYHPAVCERLRTEVMAHMPQGNLALLTHRPQSPGDFTFAYCTTMIGDQCVAANKSAGGGNSFQFPLWLYPREKQDLLDDAPQERRANFSPEFLAELKQKLGDLPLTPEDVFAYLYAVLYAPGYRTRYAEFLKRDFPRVPLTRDVALFRSLCTLGKELVALHLMEQHPKLETSYPVAGDNMVDNVRYTEPSPPAPLPQAGEGSKGRVWINQTQYFDNVPPDVWGYHIGGYQVCQKWLKDRKGRQLSYDDLTHYRGIVAALARTIELQAAIDDAIGEWPLQ
jgi:predicted helicase